jgi:hypothetical protein
MAWLYTVCEICTVQYTAGYLAYVSGLIGRERLMAYYGHSKRLDTLD